MRVITWNVAGRTNKADRQVEEVSAFRPDVVALQEVRASALGKLRDGLTAAGLVYTCDSFQFVPNRVVLKGPRQFGELIAIRHPIEPIPPGQFVVPWPERVLSCWITHPRTKIEFHTAHIPPGVTNKWIKVETFEGIYARLAQRVDYPRLLCGDFNSPDIELPDGRAKVFGEYLSRDGSIVPQRHRGQPVGRWAASERSVILGLAEHGMPDVFRTLYGYEISESSWHHVYRGEVTKRRFDHVFASPDLNPSRAEYLHALRECGLSDHSAMMVELRPC